MRITKISISKDNEVKIIRSDERSDSKDAIETTGVNPLLTTTKRARAHILVSLGCLCERCRQRPAVDRHHKDGDTGNNARDNIARLCRRCHMMVDGRIEALGKFKARKQPPKPCINCQVPSKPLSHGRCHNCKEYRRRTGRERPMSVALALAARRVSRTVG